MGGNAAWFGSTERVLEFLAGENADKVDDGRFLVTGDRGPIEGMGGDEMIIDDKINYYVDGEPRSLAAGLAKNDGGVRVVVF